MVDKSPTERFTSRVENYVRYRPSYPTTIIPLLEEQTGLDSDWSIADIGAGPGNLTRLLLDHGFRVIGVEPNDAMREAGEALLGGRTRFTSTKGTAEATSLPSGSVDLITVGQAFHWFEPAATRREFLRVLRSDGWVALIWNKRPEGDVPILDAWSEVFRANSPEFDAVRYRDDAAAAGMAILFNSPDYLRFTLPNEQELNAEAFWGRILSSSYTPLPGEPGHEEIKRQCELIFAEHSVDGLVKIPYETQVFLGQL